MIINITRFLSYITTFACSEGERVEGLGGEAQIEASCLQAERLREQGKEIRLIKEPNLFKEKWLWPFL